MLDRVVLLTLMLLCPSAFSAEAPTGQSASAGRAANREAPDNPALVKLPFSFPRGMENTPVVFRGRVLLVQNDRSIKREEQEKASLFIQDMVTGQEVARLGTGFSFVSALVDGEELNVFATVNTNDQWTKDVYRFWSSDLKSWKQDLAIRREGDEHLFNTSVCRDDRGYLMAFESNKPVQWSFRFARSNDLVRWEPVPGMGFADVAEQSFCACPAVRHVAGYYYVLYGIQREKGPGRYYQYRLPETKYVTAIARSRDLAIWDLSPTRHPMLDPIPGEGINNTDADLFEHEGNTYVYYATGDQATWGTIRVAMFAGPMKQLLEAYFPADVPAIRFDATGGKYLYPSWASEAGSREPSSRRVATP